MRPLAAVLVAAGLLTGCANAIDGTPTAAPSVDNGPTQVHLNFGPQVDPPPSGPIRELPEIVTPTGASRR